jgi:uncharacterized protein (DUF1800 family)
MTEPAVIAANRFGLGPRPGDLTTIAANPRSWLQQQISVAPAPHPALTARPNTQQRTAMLPDAKAVKAGEVAKKQLRDGLRALYLEDVSARLAAQLDTRAGFHERLVQFWSNHFTVSGTRPQVLGFVGAFEQEAIRPYVLGRFADLLRAAALHPAMLLYLDNAKSVGANSELGARRDKGLNENLARELMELHSLGVDGGYTQEDVRALANILTGWTVIRPGAGERFMKGEPGSTVFVPALHEPGSKILLGRSYPDSGADEADQAITDLARHPATARFIATKLARHFVADAPPAALVTALEQTYLQTDGDLATVYGVLIERPEAWEAAPGKMRAPNDWVIALLRGFGTTIALPGERIVAALKTLGQQPFFAPSPAGWPDQDAAWLSPEALMARVDFARASAMRAGDIDPLRFMDDVAGRNVGDATMFQLRNAASKPEGLALALLAPEFLRR